MKTAVIAYIQEIVFKEQEASLRKEKYSKFCVNTVVSQECKQIWLLIQKLNKKQCFMYTRIQILQGLVCTYCN